MNKAISESKSVAQGLPAKEGRLAQIIHWMSKDKQSSLCYLSGTSDGELANCLGANFTALSYRAEPDTDIVEIYDQTTDNIFGTSYVHYSFHVCRLSPFRYLFIRRKKDGLTLIAQFHWIIENLFSKNITSRSYSSWLAVQTFKFFVAEDIAW